MFKKVLLSLILAMVLSTGCAFALDKININTATKSELQTLNGIGEATADAIIEYRKNHGLFKSVNELVNVKGIGDKKMANLTDSLSVTDIK